MPFPAPKAASDIVAAGLSGPSSLQLAQAVANALSLYLLMPGLMTANVIGVSGPGVVSSAGPLAGYEPASFSTALLTSLSAQGLSGPTLPQTAQAVATGISLNLPMVAAVGVSPVVSNGGGVGKMVGMLPPALYGLLMSQASVLGLKGSELPRFMLGLATGICTYLNTVAVIPVVSVGAPVPPPPIGPLPMAGPAILQLV